MNRNKYNVYIDESGIHKNTGHSSIVLVYVYIKDIEVVNASIEKIENDLKISNFHWSDFGSRAGLAVRKNFIERCSRIPFTFKYEIIKNPINYKIEFYSSVLKLLTEDNIENIFIDGKQPKWYERQFKKFLRDKGISIKDFKTVNDKSVPAIRLADAIAGLIRMHYDKPSFFTENLYKQLNRRNHPP